MNRTFAIAGVMATLAGAYSVQPGVARPGAPRVQYAAIGGSSGFGATHGVGAAWGALSAALPGVQRPERMPSR